MKKYATLGGTHVVWARERLTRTGQMLKLFKVLTRPAFSGQLGNGIWFCHGCKGSGRDAHAGDAQRHALGCSRIPEPIGEDRHA